MMDYNTPNNAASQAQQQSSLGFEALLRLVFDHIAWYVLSLILCLGIAAFYVYKTPKLYVREAKVIVDESDQESMMRDMATLTRFSSVKTMKSTVENEMEAFKSPDLMCKVVQQLGLEISYSEVQPFRKVDLFGVSPIAVRLVGDNPTMAFSFVVNKTGDDSFELVDFAVAKEKLEKGLMVSGHVGDTLDTPAGKLSIVTTGSLHAWDKPVAIKWINAKALGAAYSKGLGIALSSKMASAVSLSFTSTSALKSEMVLNELIDSYNRDWIYSKTQAARNTADFINARLVTLETELAAIENDLKNYKQQNDVQDIKSLAESYMQTAQNYSNMSFRLENELASARYIKEFMMDSAHAYSMIPAISDVGSSTMMTQVTEYNTMYARRQELLSSTNENNPLVKDITTSMESLRAAIMVSLDNHISTLELQLQNVDSELHFIKGQARESSGKEYQLITIQRQQKLKESLYVFLQQKREENELSSRVTVGNIRKIMSPVGPSSPVSPKRNQILLIAFALGLALPFAVFYIVEVLDVYVRSKSDLSNMRTPFLAEIPEIGKRRRVNRLLGRPSFDDIPRAFHVKHGSRDVLNEAFRVLRTNLDMMLPKNSGHHVLMASSFNPGAGKTFVVMNISASMAVKNAKTIIVDLDLRKASLSTALKMNNKGVAAYLNGSEDDFRPLIQNVMENLDILSVGALPPNPTELLLTDRFTQMVEALAKEYDYVILDCPPVGIVADASIIASVAEQTIFIVRAGLLRKSYLMQIDALAEENTYPRMSVVLNGVDMSGKKHRYGSYGRYGYGYGYGNYGYGYGYGSDSASSEPENKKA